MLSRKMSRKLGIPYISADSLESIIREHTPRRQRAAKFPKNEIRNKTRGSNDLMYGSYSAREIMLAYSRQAKASWKALELFVECEMAEGADYILEGHQIHPELVSKLKKKYGQDIREIFLIKTDPIGLVEGALKNKARNDWFIQKTKNEETYLKIADMLCLYGKYIGKEAAKHKLTVMSTDNFQKDISRAMKVLQIKS